MASGTKSDRRFRIRLAGVVLAATALCMPVSGLARETVTVVTGKDAPELEQFAARELALQFERLFDAESELAHTPPPDGTPTVLIGSPETNPIVGKLEPTAWPQVSPQGIVIRSLDDRRLLVGGGSPAATLWAVYELGHTLGIRYLLREDIYPAGPRPLDLTGLDVVREPQFQLRTWQTGNTTPIGQESWTLDDHRRLLRQLAKLKFNRVVIHIDPRQPFVDYRSGDVEKQTAELFLGIEYPIPRDAPGRTALGQVSRFTNPDFEDATTYAERIAAGVQYIHGIIAEAHRLGMSIGISIAPLDFPPEFAAVVGAGQTPRPDAAVVTVATDRVDDPAVRELVAARIHAFHKTYPDLDAMHLRLPGDTVWVATPQAVVDSLQLDSRTEPAALSRWLRDARKRAADHRSLMVPIADARVLAQSAIAKLQDSFTEYAGDSQELIAQCWVLGELDPAIHYLARRAWNPKLTSREDHDALFTTITSKQAVSDRLRLALEHIEAATDLIDEHDSGFADAAPGMLLRHFKAEPAPEWWTSLNERYTQAMVELYRSHSSADPRSRPLLFHWAKRSEYVLAYLAAVTAVREAAILTDQGDRDAALEQLEVALEQLYNAIDTLGDIAEDPSDRGLIVMLNLYAYQPLLEKIETMYADE